MPPPAAATDMVVVVVVVEAEGGLGVGPAVSGVHHAGRLGYKPGDLVRVLVLYDLCFCQHNKTPKQECVL